MSSTITIRTDDELRRKLEERAKSRGSTVSQVARQILQEALEEKPLGTKTGHLKGKLRLSETPPDGWRKAIRDRNWRE